MKAVFHQTKYRVAHIKRVKPRRNAWNLRDIISMLSFTHWKRSSCNVGATRSVWKTALNRYGANFQELLRYACNVYEAVIVQNQSLLISQFLPKEKVGSREKICIAENIL